MIVRPQPDWPSGRVVRFRHDSKVLRNNPWSDPHERDLWVYLPPAYDESAPPYIALWCFAAFSNAGPGQLNWRGQGENLPQRLDRLIASGALPPVVVPMPDCYTSLGGNQYINSSGVGRYADYVVEELVPFLSGKVNVVDGRRGRGVFGKSSGGYGALVHAMYYPGVWGAVADHAGDVGFDWVYRPEFPRTAQVLAAYDGDPYRFLRDFWEKKRPGSGDYMTVMTLAMAASYDPGDGPDDVIRLPFDPDTLEIVPRRWARWQQHDPLQLLENHAEALAQLEMLYIDAGNRDQYNIQYGTRAFCRRLDKLGIEHHFEEFDGTHSGIDWRLDVSLPMIAAALRDAR
ncbi:MAG: alpha/beta hydrolase-fold protein [Lysobacterales bacterium]|jgi:enterochelin esterase-like enzyme